MNNESCSGIQNRANTCHDVRVRVRVTIRSLCALETNPVAGFLRVRLGAGGVALVATLRLRLRLEGVGGDSAITTQERIPEGL